MSARTLDFRYRVLRGGADVGLIRPTEDGWPSIRMDNNSEIRTSMKGVFYPPDMEINWLGDEICPEMIIDGVNYPLGIYLPATVTYKTTATGERIDLEAYDRSWLARDSKLSERQYFPAGTNYVEAASSLLAAAGISVISAVSSPLTMPEAREDWEIGTSRLAIANELLTEIGYRDVWMDASGTARLEPYETINAQNIRHTISDRDIKSLLLPGMDRNTDIYNAPNVFIAICSNPEKTNGMVAQAENNSGESPLSIPRRGRRIVQVTRVSNIASQTELQALVNRQLTDSLIAGENIQVTTGLLPGFDSGEVTALQYGELFTICREKSWSMELKAGGMMTHTLEREVLNVD